MTTNPSLPEVEAFLSEFFRPPNRFSLTAIDSGQDPASDKLLPWLDRLRGETPAATVLPCWRTSGQIDWYALAFSERQLRAISDDLLAFVGPTYSSFRGSRGAFNTEDDADSAVLRFTGGHAAKFTAPNGRQPAARLLSALELMRKVQAARPSDELIVPRATGRVLRDFYMALGAGDRISADRELSYLEQEFRLDPLNIVFLKIQLESELGDWAALLRRPELPDLFQMRRPVAVSNALIRAVYHAELARFEYDDDPLQALEHFRQDVYPRYAALYSSRLGLRSAEALKSFMLLAVAGPAPSTALRDELLRLSLSQLSGSEDKYIRKVARLLPDSERVPSSNSVEGWLPLAIAAEYRGDYEEAFRVATMESGRLKGRDAETHARVLLTCAYQLQTLEVMGVALTSVETLGKEERENTLADRRSREAYEWVRDQVAPPRTATTVSNWFEWLTAVEREPAWPQAQRVARQGVLEWHLSDFLGDPNGALRFATRLRSLRDTSPVHEALPHLLAFFQSDVEWPRREFAEVYRALLEVLVYSTRGGQDDLSVFVQFSDGLLRLGESENGYRQLLDWVIFLLDQFPSLHAVDWSLDVLDLLAVQVAPIPTLRVNVLTQVAALFQRFTAYVEPAQLSHFASLAEELGHPEIADAVQSLAKDQQAETVVEAPNDPIEALGDKTVAVYTLMESAGKRFEGRIRSISPYATVHLSHDTVGSPRLKQLAENADIFIVVTASATHAVTDFIQSHRRGGATLRPAGKGTASMLRVLRDFLISES